MALLHLTPLHQEHISKAELVQDASCGHYVMPTRLAHVSVHSILMVAH
jgi:hypothetical protein